MTIDIALQQKASEELGRCSIDLMLREPFYAHVFNGVARRISNDVPTLAVALHHEAIQLLVNPEFFLQGLKNREERVAVLKHELLHLIYKHLFRCDEERRRHLLLHNIAADLVVNQFVAPWKLPASAIVLSTFPDLGLLPDKTLGYYVKKLLELQDSIQAEEASQEEQETLSQPKTSADNENKQNQTKPSSTTSSPKKYPQSEEALRRILQSQCHSDHRYWADAEQRLDSNQTLDENLQKGLETAIENHIIRSWERAKNTQHGRLPAPLEALVQLMIEARKPKLDWKRTLRIFATSSQRTKVVSTQRKESKRFTVEPGLKPYAGLKIKRFQNLALALDVSGSIDIPVIERFFAEIQAIWKRGAEILILECDAAVQRTYSYHGKFPEKLSGGGGTHVDPVFQWLREHRSQQFDGCIYLTDGYFAAPTVRPPCPLLWVVTEGGSFGDHLLYGRRVLLPA